MMSTSMRITKHSYRPSFI